MRKRTSRPRDSVKSTSPAAPVADSASPGGVLVAVELGAEFPASPLPSGAPRRVLCQLEGEAPAAFAERVASALDSTFGRGVAIAQLSMACNERLDEAAQQARRQLAGAALGAMAKQHAGKVLFSAPPRSSGRLRHGLSTLARGLFEEWRTAGLEASVDFGAEAPPSTSSAGFLYTARVA